MSAVEGQEALRKEIRQAGGRSLLLGDSLTRAWFLLGFPLAYFLLRSKLTSKIATAHIVAGIVTTLVFAVTPAIVAGYRRFRRRQLRRKLKALPHEETTALLFSLREEGGSEVSDIVQPLIRDLRLEPRELASTEGPSGRGDEVSAAGSG